MVPPRAQIAGAVVTLCEDATFGIAAEGALDVESLSALAKRRIGAIRSGAPGMAAWEPWVLALASAIAPIHPPRWMPMGRAVAEGLSLEGGARGVRALFTSKPSDKEIARVRALGTFAVRVLGAVHAATGTFHAEARLSRAVVIASLGLPADTQQTLRDEVPTGAEALEFIGTIEPKTARHIVHGGFLAAMGDGMDPREEHAVEVIARKLTLGVDDVNGARNEARREVDASKPFGEAGVDAIRYVLADERAASDRFAVAVARLALPVVHRHEALTAVNVGGPVTLGRKHKLDKREREAVLGLAWLAALATDPPYTRRFELAVRHDDVAIDLGAPEAGVSAREAVERLLEPQIGALFGVR